jgi:hypothetical protein
MTSKGHKISTMVFKGHDKTKILDMRQWACQNDKSFLPGTTARKHNTIYNKRMERAPELESTETARAIHLQGAVKHELLNHGFSLCVILVLTLPALEIVIH